MTSPLFVVSSSATNMLRRLGTALWSSKARDLPTAGTPRFMSCCHWYDPREGGENIWQVDVNSLKYGPGALREVGLDAWNLGLRKVAVYTDKNQNNFPHLSLLVKSLKDANVEVTVYDEVKVEPTDISFKNATQFANEGNFDGFISLGGGSVIDTCKAANLYHTYPDEFLAYVNPPIGQGKLIPGPLKPHIACPTTAGTGSESTGLAIFDLLSMHAKTGIGGRRLRPTLAVVDPNVTLTMPSQVVAASGFDVLSHALESYTARPYTHRAPPSNPANRPMSQGSNPFSDTGCLSALKLTGAYLERAVHDANDYEARERMMFASTLAGIAFGNVGCHMPHGMSYPVSGQVREYRPPQGSGYPLEAPIVPHGYSVILNAPSVFRFTAPACPDRHIEAAAQLGGETRGATDADAGEVVASRIIELMKATHIPNGLNEVGFSNADLDQLTAGAMPQKRLLDNAPLDVTQEDVAGIYRGAMKYW